MHVAKVSKKYVTKDGVSRESVAYLLRRTYRDGVRVKHETLANLSALPQATLEAVRVSLTGQALVVPGQDLEVTGSCPHGHVAAVHAQAKALGLPALLGPAGRDRDIALALIIARVCRPASKLATTRWWADTTLAADLGVADATTDEVYAAMDWLAGRQDAIETKLVRTHLTGAGNPDRLALFDLSSSWVTGRCCPLAARGYSRDGKKGLPQIEYGLLTDPAGRPVAVRVFPGNTADPTAFTTIVEAVKDTYRLTDMVMVGDRGMITSARVEALRELGGYGWVTALRAPAIAALAADDGPLQMSLFDQANLAEITHPDYPGERLVACRNPALATERARKRLALLEATDTELAKITAAVAAGRLAGAGKIGIRVGKVIGRYKMAKHYILDITDDQFAFTRDQDQITAEAALDGLYVIRTTVRPRADGPGQSRGHLQVPGPGGTRLPLHQEHRPGPAPDPPLHRNQGPRPRVHLHARRLPGLAPTPSLGAVDVHRRTPTRPHRPRRPRPTLPGRRPQGSDQDHHRRPARHQLHQPAGPPGHPDPQPPTRRRPRRVRLRPARHPHPHPTPSLRTPRRPDPTDPEVARTPNPKTRKTPAQQGFHAFSDT